MTKERKIAIKVWEKIRDDLANNRIAQGTSFWVYKREIVRSFGITHWSSACWLCQYVRRDYDSYGDFWEKTGKAKGLGEEGCNFCPLAKANPLYNPSDATCDCGCFLKGSPWTIVSNSLYTADERVAACNTIIRALKGEPITVKVPKEVKK